MTLEQLTEIANNYADEQFDEGLVMDYVNEAISKINIGLDVTLPFFTEETTTYDAIDESWQRALFVPYIVYSIKLNDGSMNEASYAYGQRFEPAMRELKRSRSFDIPKKYRLRWVPATSYEYASAGHTYDYSATTAYEIDTETLPALGQVVSSTVPIKFSDTVIKVTLAEAQVEYYKLADRRQVADIVTPRIIKTGDGWWF